MFIKKIKVAYKYSFLIYISWVIYIPNTTAQVVPNMGFYRYNWQFFNPAALSYEYFHRKQEVSGTWYASRKVNISLGYRQQSRNMTDRRTYSMAQVEFLPTFRNQRKRADNFRFKINGGILNNAWGTFKETTPFGGCAGAIALSKTIRMIGGINMGITQINPDQSRFSYKDPQDADIQALWQSQTQAMIVPGILITDFRRFYSGLSAVRPFSTAGFTQFHAIIGYNFVNEQERRIGRGGKKADLNIIRTLSYDSGISVWLRYARPNGYENVIGNYSPLSARFNYRLQLPVPIGRNTLWANTGISTTKYWHLELGYTHFAASEMGIARGVNCDFRLGIGWDIALSRLSNHLGNSFEINLGTAL